MPRNPIEIVEAGTRQPPQPAGLLKEPVGELERVAPSRPAAEHHGEQLVVTEPDGAKALQLLARTVVLSDGFHLYSNLMSRSSLREAPLRLLLALPLFFIAACAAPPNREIGDAQNALKAAKEAGAEKYAAGPFDLASESYRLANEAVLNGDYRLALNKALESREHSQNAIRLSSDVNIRARQQATDTMADVAALLVETSSRIEQAERAGASRRVVTEARRALGQVTASVQEASAAMKANEFATAQPILDRVKARLEKTLGSLRAATPQSSKRRP